MGEEQAKNGGMLARPAPSELVPSDGQILRRALVGTLRDHRHELAPSSGVIRLQFLPNGDILTAGTEGWLRRWDPGSGRCMAGVEAHPHEWIHGLALSSDGRVVVTAAGGGLAKAWQLDGFAHLSDFVGHDDFLLCADISPDGELLATGSNDRTARLWRVTTGELVATLRKHRGQVNSVRFSPDGRVLATGSHDGRVLFWSIPDGAPFEGPLLHGDLVQDIRWTRDGHRLATACYDGVVRVWRIWWDALGGYRGGGELERALTGHEGRATGVRLDATDQKLFSSGADGTIRQWDLETGTGQTLSTSRIPCFAVAIDEARGRIAVGGWCYRHKPYSGRARVWRLDAPEKSPVLLGLPVSEVCEATVEPQSHLLIRCYYTEQWQHTFHGLDPENGRRTELYRADAALHGLQSLPPFWCERADDGTTVLVDRKCGQRLQLVGHTKTVGSAHLSGEHGLVTSSADGTAGLWDTRTGQRTAIYGGHSGAVRGAVPTPEGTHLITASDGTVRVWMLDGTPVRTLRGVSQAWAHWDILFHGPDHCVTGWGDGAVRIWNWSTGELTSVLAGPDEGVTCLEWSFSGTLLVGHDDGHLQEWNLATGTRLRGRRLHREATRSTAFRSSGTQLVTASLDGTVCFWDAESWELIATYHSLDHGYLWTTPPTEDAPSGWLATDRPELVRVVTTLRDGSTVVASPEERQHYLSAFNDLDRVLVRLRPATVANLPASSGPAMPRALTQLSSSTPSSCGNADRAPLQDKF